ncbi:4-hydroxy-3-methylbut-2-enyl diphosphate reductase IspH [Clostridium aceticum]|uniref:4-hydroxy-3-methylbut-2-enyl diphosphate reductase n=1 Tax=Clostridium aceticum TaxID=84022 RepID=A0A0D8IEU4_9CLOT|nr:4-hydroxy-3-methylbut-2-enyl diphosphate reductase [Clostridium aceticum]AKL95398.1 4-hydroxy-3-methylbut-2-enyl diphosphate reductase IspH [Clostridium aceticum]KJF28798.1 4-hydroxy-3-methylbut-2-enyl diphosphate reductase [Clostridium aceticum]
MKVTLADYSGFCFGVEKAITTTFEELDHKDKSQKIFSLGPLIHNVQVVKELEERGVMVTEDIGSIQEGSVIIRSHGVPKSVYETADKMTLTLIDATCPFVKRIQTIVEEYYKKGYAIAIIGNPQHPEVIGINGWCDNKALIIQEEKEVENVPDVDKLCIVVQTTMSIAQFEKISAVLEKKARLVTKFNTICSATKQRQKAAKDLAEKVDAMIVIGGYHSSNTQKLVSICNDIRPEATFHVETSKDLPVEALKQYDLVGVTAGASTPKWVINEIIQKLRNI